MNKRQVVLDTETTGLDPALGHRVIEIGCIEIIDRRPTQNHYHVYLQPDRAIDEGAQRVHGITAEFLKDKPRFTDITEAFLAFIEGAELVIHNAPFDIGFLNHELGLLESPAGPIERFCSVTDTLKMARRKHPGQRNSLDALCKRYSVDSSERSLHGALLDARLLAEVYLSMTGGQTAMSLEVAAEPAPARGNSKDGVAGKLRKAVIVKVPDEDHEAHRAYLATMREKGACLWLEPREDPQEVEG